MRIILGGVSGRTGLEVAKRLIEMPDVEVTGAVGAQSVGTDLGALLGPKASGRTVMGSVEEAFKADGADVYVDFTHAQAARLNALAAVPLGLRPLVGTSGLDPAALEELKEAVLRYGLSGAVIPNFSLGSLWARRAALAMAENVDQVEIIEMHSRHKRDKPSGTARDLAEALAAMGVKAPIHSVRLDGVVAHQVVMFGLPGETITIRHDVTSRTAYADGVAACARALMVCQGFFTDMGDLLEEKAVEAVPAADLPTRLGRR